MFDSMGGTGYRIFGKSGWVTHPCKTMAGKLHVSILDGDVTAAGSQKMALLLMACPGAELRGNF